MSVLGSIILASLIISTLSLLGGFFLLRKKLFTKRFITYFVSFAAGVMLSAAFLDLLPEALEYGQVNNILSIALFGVVVSFFMERSIMWHHHHEETHAMSPSVVLVLIGDTIHNFIDGVAIAAAFLTNPALGVTTTFAIAAHEIPQELADFSILIHAGVKEARALLLNLLSALTALIGALAGFYFLNQFESKLPLALGFAAGMFIYISCADLIPDLHRDFDKRKGWTQVIPFVFGIVIMFFLTQFMVE